MTTFARLCGAGVLAGSIACTGLAGAAHAGGFSVREQSTTYQGTAFAGSAAGGDISSMYWNAAAAAASPGCSALSSYSLILGSSDLNADSGRFVTGLVSNSTDVGSDVIVPASYVTCQLSDKLFVGLALNSPFGLLTKPDNVRWAGSPIAVTSKVFNASVAPTVAYKITPTLTLGVGLQVEYFRIRLNHAAFAPQGLPIAGSRSFEADDWGIGATVGLLWAPLPGTEVGVGFRSAVGLDVSGSFTRGQGALPPPAFRSDTTASLMLPEQVTFSFRQALAPRWAVLGTVEWQNWSRLGDVSALGPGCPSGVCEVLNLNFRDGWFFSLGAEYTWSPTLLLRGGLAYEISPIQDSTRSIILPDSNRVWLSFGASYRYSEHIIIDFAYSHIFFADAPFCIASPDTGSTHCNASTPAQAILLRGDSDNSVDIISVGLRYRF